MFLIEHIRQTIDKFVDFESYKSMSFSDKLDMVNEVSAVTTDALHRLRDFLKLMLDEGMIHETKTEKEREEMYKNFNIKKKDPKLMKKAADLLQLDLKVLEKYKLNPFNAITVSIKNGLALMHYQKTFFLYGSSEGDNLWSPVLRQARGVMFKITKVDDEDSYDKPMMRARAFEKFFNLGETGISEVSTDKIIKLAETYSYSLSDKWDGHLGIIYLDNSNKIRITTKGTLNRGEDSPKNESILKDLIKKGKINGKILQQKMKEGYVPIVEIIAEHTAVHVPYSITDLILTGVNKIDFNTGELERELSNDEVTEFSRETGFTRTLPITGKGVKTFIDFLEKTKREKFESAKDIKEGAVATFYEPNGDIKIRVKIKYMAYIQLMKADKINYKKIMNMMSSGSDYSAFTQFLKGMSEFEELFPSLSAVISNIVKSFRKNPPSSNKPTIKDKEIKTRFIDEILEFDNNASGYISGFSKKQLEEKTQEDIKENLKDIANKTYNKLTKTGVEAMLNSIPSMIRTEVKI